MAAVLAGLAALDCGVLAGFDVLPQKMRMMPMLSFPHSRNESWLRLETGWIPPTMISPHLLPSAGAVDERDLAEAVVAAMSPDCGRGRRAELDVGAAAIAMQPAIMDLASSII